MGSWVLSIEEIMWLNCRYLTFILDKDHRNAAVWQEKRNNDIATSKC